MFPINADNVALLSLSKSVLVQQNIIFVSVAEHMHQHSYYPDPYCYRPIRLYAMAKITSPSTESPRIWLPLLEISNGLPPPELLSELPPELAVVVAVGFDEVLVALEPLFELVVEVVVVVFWSSVDVEVVEVSEVEDADVDAIDVEVVVDADVTVTETTELDLVDVIDELVVEVVFAMTDVDVDVVFKPNPPVTP